MKFIFSKSLNINSFKLILILRHSMSKILLKISVHAVNILLAYEGLEISIDENKNLKHKMKNLLIY